MEEYQVGLSGAIAQSACLKFLSDLPFCRCLNFTLLLHLDKAVFMVN
jgi:hypothetical protein